MVDLLSLIRTVEGFPKPGISFKDITTLIKDPEGLKQACDQLAEHYRGKGVTKVVGMESRGFIFGTVVAYLLGVGFVPIRKPGKLPAETISETYELEYGTDTLEMHVDAVGSGDKVLIIDDLLATGGTAEAAARLVQKAGGEVVGIGFVIELTGSLHGRKKLEDMGLEVFALLDIPVEE